MATLLDVALAAAAAPAAAAGGYLAALAAAARPAPRPPECDTLRFDVVVPAHNEEAGIGATLASLRGIDYPAARVRVLVVADNCTDRTAERARACGATVVERHDPERRGKGYALAHAYAASLRDGIADAIVVVDADTAVSPNLLRAAAARLAAGADCVQADYGVRNAGDSWRTRLMAVAFTCYHGVRSLGRERLGLSCGLRGNGMAFRADLLRRHPHAAYSRVEDVEYGVALGLAGVRVAYAHEARVLGDMPASAAAARSQRERWEGGRAALARRAVPGLVRAAWTRRDPVSLDLAADLLVPPLATLAAYSAAGAALAALAAWAGHAGALGAAGWAFALAALGVHVARGAVLAGAGPRVLLDLGRAPAYAAWKLTLPLRRLLSGPRGGTDPEVWVRTARAGSPSDVATPDLS